jgi:two-component system, response regulator PdtaR
MVIAYQKRDSCEMEAVLHEAGAKVVAVAGSFDEALERCQTLQPTLALINLKLAGPEDGIELAHQLWDRLGVRAIFVTGHSNPESVYLSQPDFLD